MNESTDYSGRHIVERLWVAGTLELVTPAHLGNGDAEALTDMPLLRDSVENRALLTGTSLAGALRAWVREFDHGYGARERSGDRACTLFGTVRGQESVQSWLIVDDAFSATEPQVTLRDGVALCPATRTAEEGKKYDIELLEAGTAFSIELELLLPAGDSSVRQRLVETLALALDALAKGEIGLGMRKRRGLGECRVTRWQVCLYQLTTPEGLLGWLNEDRSGASTGQDIGALLGVDLAVARQADARKRFTIEACLALETSLLIRATASGSDAKDVAAPDVVHLHARRGDKDVPVVSGTSLTGALRARALRIANTLLDGQGADLVDTMFGPRLKEDRAREDRQPSGSRVVVRESAITGVDDRVQQRVKIDRFTGGAYPQALFAEQPLFANEDSILHLWLELRAPQDHEIGLLLLVLKDLWTGDLPLGGESSVGRGRMQGRRATLVVRDRGSQWRWTLEQRQPESPALVFGGDREPGELERYVEALHKYAAGRVA